MAKENKKANHTSASSYDDSTSYANTKSGSNCKNSAENNVQVPNEHSSRGSSASNKSKSNASNCK